MKTPGQILDLKMSWLRDPSWNIEETKGFELHKEYLKNWRENKEKKWNEMYEAEMMKIAEEIGFPNNISHTEYLERMKNQIELLKNVKI